MAVKGQKEEMFPLEELAKAKKIPNWQLAGVMASKNWAKGKEVTEAEFDASVKAFLNGPMTGPEEKGGVDNGELA